MLNKRMRAAREVRKVFSIVSWKAKPAVTPIVCLTKDVDGVSASTQDVQAIAPPSEEVIYSPVEDDKQTRKDREAVKAENASVYDRDLEPENGIRLLRIHPGDGPICASLEYYDLEDPELPQYDALSYCWGSQQHLNPIQVDHKPDFQLSGHLHAAMKRLRRANKDRLIWIDVICVNQANIPERNRSVQLMWKIYANAHRVIVWVGEIEAEAKTCKRLFAASEAESAQLTWCTQLGLAALEHDNATTKLNEVLQSLEWQSSTNGGDVWWKRLWVIQEFSRARDFPTIYVGPHAISWKYFAKLMRTDTHDRLPLFHRLRSQEEQSLLQLLSSAKAFYCSDPRDRIYALLGLVKGGQTSIVPDYSKPVPQVYEEATHYLIQAERNVDVLLDERMERTGGGYPTWVPHFTMLRDREIVRTVDGYDAGHGEPRVALVQSVQSECAKCSSSTGQALRMHAVPFGKITRRTTEDTLPGPDLTHRTILTRHGNINKQALSRPLQTLDHILAHLAIDFSRQPSLPLDRSSGIGYLMLDYLFNGERSAVDEFSRVEEPGPWRAQMQACSGEMEKLAQKYKLRLTDAKKLDIALSALWENAFLFIRHKTLYTPTDQERAFLGGQEMYHVPAKLRKRDFFATADGFIGLGPETMREGDEVIVPFGASRPFIVRSHGDHHVLIGDAVVPGIMSGQLMNLYREGSVAAADYYMK